MNSCITFATGSLFNKQVDWGPTVIRWDTWPAQMSKKTVAFHRKTVSLRRTENSQMNQTEMLMLIKENDCWVNSAVFYFTTASLCIFNTFSLQHFKSFCRWWYMVLMMPIHTATKGDQGGSSSQPEINYFTLDECNAILWGKFLSKYIKSFALLTRSETL